MFISEKSYSEKKLRALLSRAIDNQAYKLKATKLTVLFPVSTQPKDCLICRYFIVYFTALESTTLTVSSKWIYFRRVEKMNSKVWNLQHNKLKIWRKWISQLILGFWIGESYNRCPLWLLGCLIYSPKVVGISSTLDRTMTNNLIQKQKLKILIEHEHCLVRLSGRMVRSRVLPFYLVNWPRSAQAEICSLKRAGLLSAVRVLMNFIFQLFFWTVHL